MTLWLGRGEDEDTKILNSTYRRFPLPAIVYHCYPKYRHHHQDEHNNHQGIDSHHGGEGETKKYGGFGHEMKRLCCNVETASAPKRVQIPSRN